MLKLIGVIFISSFCIFSALVYGAPRCNLNQRPEVSLSSGCRNYVVCLKGRLSIESCPPDHIFDVELDVCRPKEFTSGCQDRRKLKCPKPNGLFLKPGSDCQKYYKCQNGVGIEMKCPYDELFNVFIGRCDFKDMVDCVQEDSKEVETSTKVPETKGPETISSTVTNNKTNITISTVVSHSETDDALLTTESIDTRSSVNTDMSFSVNSTFSRETTEMTQLKSNADTEGSSSTESIKRTDAILTETPAESTATIETEQTQTGTFGEETRSTISTIELELNTDKTELSSRFTKESDRTESISEETPDFTLTEETTSVTDQTRYSTVSRETWQTESVSKATEVHSSTTTTNMNSTPIIINSESTVSEEFTSSNSPITKPTEVTKTIEDNTESIPDKTESTQDKTESTQDKTESIQDKTESILDKTESIQDKTESIQDKTETIQDKTETIQDITTETYISITSNMPTSHITLETKLEDKLSTTSGNTDLFYTDDYKSSSFSTETQEFISSPIIQYTQPTEIITNASSTTFLPSTRDACDTFGDPNCLPDKNQCPEISGLFPHSHDKTLFLHCDHWRPYIKNCPDRLEFDPKEKVCAWPSLI